MARELNISDLTKHYATNFSSTKYQKIESAGELQKVEGPDAAAGATVGSQTLHNRTVGYRPQYADASDAYANHSRNIISFLHVPSEQTIYCKAFITSFNETYKSDWATEHVFGRIDPIYSFKNTGRSITLNFNMPAATEGEAFENLHKVGFLSDMLYPNYTRVGSAQTISQSPLIRMKVMNLLQSQRALYNEVRETAGLGGKWDWAGPQGRQFENLSQGNNNSATMGQLGVITSLTINHNLEKSDAGVIEAGRNLVLPKVIEVSISFDVIHEVPRGWNGRGWHQNVGGPYGLETRTGPNGNVSVKFNSPTAFSEIEAANIAAQTRQEKEREDTEKGRVAHPGAQQTKDNAAAQGGGVFSDLISNRGQKKVNKAYADFEREFRAPDYEGKRLIVNDLYAHYEELERQTGQSATADYSDYL